MGNTEPSLRRAAIRGLAEYRHPDTATTLLVDYAMFDAAARQDILQTLAARVDWAMPLMDAIESKQVPRTDVTAYTARQLVSLNDEKLSVRLKAVWGELRTTPAEKEPKLSVRFSMQCCASVS